MQLIANMKESILIVEDAESLRDVLSSVLEHEGYSVVACASTEEAEKILSREKFSLILSDFKLPDKSGIELLKLARARYESIPFLIMTAYGSIEIAVEAMKYGANDFICKPFEPEQICSLVSQVIEHRRLIDREGSGAFGARTLITQDSKMKAVIEQAKRCAKFPTSVLILGESGTGKELIARLVHENSARKDKAFVSVNCAAFPADLLESEFFGHEAGAFTGATQTRIGLLEIASQGTIFLDEIGDMPPQLQVKLLRALQEREIKRVGGNKTIKVDPRIISATNIDIKDSIANGKLREDFYYRIAVMTLEIPALRERKADVDLLADHFVKVFAKKSGKEKTVLDEVARDVLKFYRWPGNVRELENVMERAVILANEKIGPEHLGISVSLDISSLENAAATLPQIANEAVRKAEVEAILKTLERVEGNKSRAAEVLGVSYKTLLNKIKEYQLT